MFKASIRDITTIPFQNGLESLPGLESYSSWILPQALANLSTAMKLVRNEAGLVSPTATLVAFRAALESEAWPDNGPEYWVNLLKFLVQTPRGSKVLGTLKAIDKPDFSALVPLALSAFKKYRGVKYSEWDWSDPRIGVFVDPSLLEASIITVPPFSPEKLVKFRETASVVKSSGKIRTNNQMTTIYKVGDDDFDELPNLTKIMLLQTWIASPKYRTELMILQPNNLDEMPEPLTEVEIEIAKSREMPPW